MKYFKILCCTILALAAMTTLFQPGVRVIVGDTPLPGIYEPEAVLQCETQAKAAAEEICRAPARGDYRLIPVLCIRHTVPQQLQLTRVLLESYEGVQRVYAIRAGSEALGNVKELSEVYALRAQFPALPLTITPTYTHTDTPANAAEIFARLETYAENYVSLF